MTSLCYDFQKDVVLGITAMMSNPDKLPELKFSLNINIASDIYHTPKLNTYHCLY